MNAETQREEVLFDSARNLKDPLQRHPHAVVAIVGGRLRARNHFHACARHELVHRDAVARARKRPLAARAAQNQQRAIFPPAPVILFRNLELISTPKTIMKRT